MQAVIVFGLFLALIVIEVLVAPKALSVLTGNWKQLEPESFDENLFVFSITHGRDKYIWVFRDNDGDLKSVAESAARFARDPGLNFDYRDASTVIDYVSCFYEW